MDKRNLLVVDDDPSVCECIRLIGESCGFIVTSAHSATEFRRVYTTLKPDMITLDLNLGSSDGIELLRILGRDKSSAKIVFISSYDAKVINSALLLGSAQKLHTVAAMHKPLEPDRLRMIFQSVLNEFTPITQNMLAEAIKNGDFLLLYQPKISMKTGELVGVEALIRWRLAENNIISPDAFIYITEECNLIAPLSSWVNEEAIKQCAEFKKNGLDIGVSINMSAKLLTDLTLPDELHKLTKHYGVMPEKICLEITESSDVGNSTLTMDVLTRFRIKGFCLSIDDFGTGYSSLVELQSMPCSELKIDKSFVINLMKDTPEYIIVRAIINLGHEFGLQLIAEGVETAQTFALLKELGCDVAQGFYIGYPMLPDELMKWVDRNMDNENVFQFPIESEY